MDDRLLIAWPLYVCGCSIKASLYVNFKRQDQPRQVLEIAERCMQRLRKRYLHLDV